MWNQALSLHAVAAVLAGALTALGLGACDHATAPREVSQPVSQISGVVITGMRGAGAIGRGEPTSAGGVNRQEFTLDAGIKNGLVYGTLDYTDYSFTKSDGKPPHFVVGPTYPGTVVATFVQTSSTCVEFDGMGEVLNTGELLAFRVQACDNGSPGVGRDVFAIYVPERLLTDGQPYQRGPDVLSDGELILSGVPTPVLAVTHAPLD